MLTRIVVSIVRACTRFALLTVLVALGLAIGSGYYAARHFGINTDINTLISPNLDWRQRDNQFGKAFDRERTILAVDDAPTPELTGVASNALAGRLRGDTHFESGIRRVLRSQRPAVSADRRGRPRHRPV